MRRTRVVLLAAAVVAVRCSAPPPPPPPATTVPATTVPTPPPTTVPSPTPPPTVAEAPPTTVAAVSHPQAAKVPAKVVVPAPPPSVVAPAPEVVPPAPPRAFVADIGVVEGQSVEGKKIPGFSESMREVHKAPRSSGRLDFETDPVQASPGQPLTVRVFVNNLNQKVVNLSAMRINTIANGASSGGPVPLRATFVNGRQRALVYEWKTTWPEPAPRTWELRAYVSAKNGDIYTNILRWK